EHVPPGQPPQRGRPVDDRVREDDEGREPEAVERDRDCVGCGPADQNRGGGDRDGRRGDGGVRSPRHPWREPPGTLCRFPVHGAFGGGWLRGYEGCGPPGRPIDCFRRFHRNATTRSATTPITAPMIARY